MFAAVCEVAPVQRGAPGPHHKHRISFVNAFVCVCVVAECEKDVRAI